jgi:hypothetical protein
MMQSLLSENFLSEMDIQLLESVLIFSRPAAGIGDTHRGLGEAAEDDRRKWSRTGQSELASLKFELRCQALRLS